MPSPSYEFAASLAADVFGVTGTLSPLHGEFDDNWRVEADDGARRVLKVMSPDRARSLVDLQCAALDHLARLAPGLALPRVHHARSGAQVVEVDDPDGRRRLAWMLTWVEGQTLASTRPHAAELLVSVGSLLGRMDGALESFDHPAADRDLSWDVARAGWIRTSLDAIPHAGRRATVARFLALYDDTAAPVLSELRRSVIHGDANDHNVIVQVPRARAPRAVSVIDFGDMLRTATVCEPAVAAAYALLAKPDPLGAAAHVIAGYHAAHPLDEEEMAVLFPLIAMRLCVSVVTSAGRKAQRPDDPYVTISEAPAWDALIRLTAIHPRFAHAVFRHACGLAPVPTAARIAGWLDQHADEIGPVLDVDLQTEPALALDLSIGSRLLGADPTRAETGPLTDTILGALKAVGAKVGLGRYDEARGLYTAAAFGVTGDPTGERRTIHLGIDVFVAPGSAVRAPLDGRVHTVVENAARQDYGPLVILEHEPEPGVRFFTLYGHLSTDALTAVREGASVARGAFLGSVGAPPANGDWPPHLHFQVIADLLDLGRDFPGVAPPSQRTVWTSLSPDPNVVLRIPAERLGTRKASREELLGSRRSRIGSSVRLSYDEPLAIVRGWRQFLYDECGREYLDAYNNVPVVGHSHPDVVAAAHAQSALLNTNTRYLHESLVCYADRLTRLMPAPLRVCFIVNSASEANELAIRLARAHTGRRDVIVLDHAYHGHTTTLIDLSPYKFNGPGGLGRPPWVHVAPLPDDYRGPYKRDDPAAGAKYAAHVAEITEGLRAAKRGIAAFLAESLPSVAGQIVFPPGYLAEAYRHVRAAGGLCVADEVQVGFGRLGTHLWGFATQDAVPDIVVLGKPIGNGYPLAAVVTTAEVARSFDNGMEFFSTFGGNPVACEVGLAVLDVLEREHLQDNALRVGQHLLAGLRRLLDRHPIVGDVRGQGLFIGVELVRDRTTLEPAGDEAGYVVNRLRDRGILTGTDGPYHNVIKIRPPLVFAHHDADRLVALLDEVLGEDPLRV